MSRRGRGLRILCEVDGDCELETWGATGRRELLERILGVAVSLEAIPLRNRRGARSN